MSKQIWGFVIGLIYEAFGVAVLIHLRGYRTPVPDTVSYHYAMAAGLCAVGAVIALLGTNSQSNPLPNAARVLIGIVFVSVVLSLLPKTGWSHAFIEKKYWVCFFGSAIPGFSIAGMCFTRYLKSSFNFAR